MDLIFKKTNSISKTALSHFTNFHFSTQISHQLVINPFEASKLLNSYCKNGKIEDARNLFDEIPLKRLVHWSIMIYGYATNGFHLESMKMFSNMQIMGKKPNSFTIVGLLVSSVNSKDLVLGRSVHGLVAKTGLESNVIVGTALLDMYAKCGRVFDSYKFFQEMDEPGFVSCNAVVTGFIYNGLFAEALELCNRFRRAGLVLSSVTMLSIVQGSAALESCGLCGSIHGLGVKTGLCSVISVANAILDMYSSLGDLESAAKVFGHMKAKDVISWTTMIGLLVRLELAADAVMVFMKMRNNGVSLDTVVLVNLLMACALLGDLKMGRLVHTQAVVGGYASELPVSNSLIAMYSKCGDLGCSRIEFYGRRERSLVSWTAMVSGCVQNGQPREALELLVRMRAEEGFALDPVILSSLVTACGELAGLEPCQQLHCYVYKAGFHYCKSVQNSLISGYSKCGGAELANKVFKDMHFRDIVSWNAVISGFGMNGRGEAAVALFRQMENNGESPDSVTYLSVLGACSHSGLVDDGLMIFNEMVEGNKIKPSREHCGCIVDMLARAGRLSDASRFTSTMSENVDPNVWRALLGGCRIHGNVELAELAAERLSKLEPEDSGDVVLLSNVYASVGRFQEAEALRLNMRMKGLMKEPGITLLDGTKG